MSNPKITEHKPLDPAFVLRVMTTRTDARHPSVLRNCCWLCAARRARIIGGAVRPPESCAWGVRDRGRSWALCDYANANSPPACSKTPRILSAGDEASSLGSVSH